jgi:hypothetical protein
MAKVSSITVNPKKSINEANDNVTVTHFSEFTGSKSSNLFDDFFVGEDKNSFEISESKDFQNKSNNNPFYDKTDAITFPFDKNLSTNPFHSSFNSDKLTDNSTVVEDSIKGIEVESPNVFEIITHSVFDEKSRSPLPSAILSTDNGKKENSTFNPEKSSTFNKNTTLNDVVASNSSKSSTEDNKHKIENKSNEQVFIYVI